MPKIERRRTTVTLHHGHYEAELAELMEQASIALRAEQSGATPRRAGTKTKSNEISKQYDALRAEADETAVNVTVWALKHDDWDALCDEHPPRDENPDDARHGVNMKTFPKALAQASLVTPDEPGAETTTLTELKAKGATAMAELELSRIHYRRVETAAWNVNVGDDALPKFSLVSLVNQERDQGSKPPSASE